jgi:hypothetical protein
MGRRSPTRAAPIRSLSSQGRIPPPSGWRSAPGAHSPARCYRAQGSGLALRLGSPRLPGPSEARRHQPLLSEVRRTSVMLSDVRSPAPGSAGPRLRPLVRPAPGTGPELGCPVRALSGFRALAGGSPSRSCPGLAGLGRGSSFGGSPSPRFAIGPLRPGARGFPAPAASWLSGPPAPVALRLSRSGARGSLALWRSGALVPGFRRPWLSRSWPVGGWPGVRPWRFWRGCSVPGCPGSCVGLRAVVRFCLGFS